MKWAWRALVTPGKTRVAFEEPGYPPARTAFLAAGAQLVAVPLDDEGLRRALRQLDVRLPAVGDGPYVNSRPGSLHSQLQALDPLGVPPGQKRRG